MKADARRPVANERARDEDRELLRRYHEDGGALPPVARRRASLARAPRSDRSIDRSYAKDLFRRFVDGVIHGAH